MADQAPHQKPEQPPARRWDYSRELLKDGGTQIVALAIAGYPRSGWMVTLVLLGLFLLGWILLSAPPRAPGRGSPPASRGSSVLTLTGLLNGDPLPSPHPMAAGQRYR